MCFYVFRGILLVWRNTSIYLRIVQLWHCYVQSYNNFNTNLLYDQYPCIAWVPHVRLISWDTPSHCSRPVPGTMRSAPVRLPTTSVRSSDPAGMLSWERRSVLRSHTPSEWITRPKGLWMREPSFKYKSTWLTSSINVTVWQNVCFKCYSFFTEHVYISGPHCCTCTLVDILV